MSSATRTTSRIGRWLAALHGDRWALVLSVTALLALTAVDLSTPLIMVSTLGIIVVVLGLFAHPRTVVLVGALAITLAVLLVSTSAEGALSPLRVLNVVIGSGIALASAGARHHRLRDLQRLRRRDVSLLRSIGDGICGVDADGRVTFMNIAAQRMLGVGEVDARGRPLLAVLGLDPEASEGPPGSLREALRAQRPRGPVADLVVHPPARPPLPVEYVVEPLVDDERGAVISFRDISSRLSAARDRERLLRLQVQEQEHKRVVRSLEQALRPSPPKVEHTGIDVTYLPADEHAPSGGDLYDVCHLPDGSVHVLVVDVVGHDVASTRDALQVEHLARALTMTGVPIGDLVTELDRFLAAEDDALMATLVVVRYHPGTGRLELASGGHPPALLVRSGGQAEWLEAKGRPLGFPLAGSDEVIERRLEPGDLLLLYTDGLVEAERDITVGLQRLAEHARELREEPLEGWTGKLTTRQLCNATRKDDTLTLALRRLATADETSAGPPRVAPGAQSVGSP